ncbi:hypothetical protein DOT_2712 [Desulfosporosinus sp. OT]|nr:hypothetical protein DOT_2712 [Desulfosporosinus sp. OT]
MIKEAELLHHLDMIDSRMFDVDKAVTRQAPKKFYRNGSLSVWSLEGPFEVEQASEKWGVALFHIRTPKKIVIVDGGTFPPPEGVDLNVLIVDSEPTGEPDPKMVCISREGF